MYNKKSLLRRVLSPRVVVYCLLTLILAWLMNRNSQIKKANRQQEEIFKKESAEIIAEKKGLTFKDSELSSGDKRNKKMLLLIADVEGSLLPLKEELQKEFGNDWQIVILNSKNTEDNLKFFQLKKLPAALLYDLDNQELARKEENINFAELSAILKKFK